MLLKHLVKRSGVVVTTARAAQDRFVTALARSPYGRSTSSPAAG
jgi:hypothetical protein